MRPHSVSTSVGHSGSDSTSLSERWQPPPHLHVRTSLCPALEMPVTGAEVTGGFDRWVCPVKCGDSCEGYGQILAGICLALFGARRSWKTMALRISKCPEALQMPPPKHSRDCSLFRSRGNRGFTCVHVGRRCVFGVRAYRACQGV